MTIPLCRPDVTDEDIAAVTTVLRSGHWAGGPEVKAFEAEFAAFVGARFACAVNSCASALQLAIDTLPKKGEVIIPSFTFAATANAVAKGGCTPVFCDVGLDTANLDPGRLAPLLTERTVAVMPVHYAGLACDMHAITAFCQAHHLHLIEDCAQAAGATWKNGAVGSFGVGCFSFFPTKNMSTGEGGMITTSDPEQHKRLTCLRGHGVVRMEGADWQRDVAEPGQNFRMTDFQAALGRSQLRRLHAMNQVRRQRAAEYRRQLSNHEHVSILSDNPHHVYQMFVIRVHDTIDRDAVVRYMRQADIEASVHFDPPVHRTTAYRTAVNLPNTDTLARSCITLPMYTGLSENDVERVSTVLLQAIERCRLARR